MSFSNWLPSPPVGVGLIVILTLVSLALTKHEQKSDAAYQAARHEYDQSKQVVTEDAAAHRSYTGEKAYREEWRAEQDLEAQRDMAWWSKIASIATCIGVFLLAATLWETTRTTAAAAAATRAANKALEHSKETAERELRAYLSIESMNLIRDGDSFNLRTKIVNDGQTPARGVRAWLQMGVRTPAGENIVEEEPGEQGSASLGTGKWVTVPAQITLTAAEMAQIEGGQRTIFVWGRVTYVDIFDKDRFVTVCGRMGSERGENEWAIETTANGNEHN